MERKCVHLLSILEFILTSAACTLLPDRQTLVEFFVFRFSEESLLFLSRQCFYFINAKGMTLKVHLKAVSSRLMP